MYNLVRVVQVAGLSFSVGVQGTMFQTIVH